MGIGSIITITLIAIIHYYIFITEVFFWNKPLGLKVFNLEQDFANKTRVMAINQGVYNLFLAGGLTYALLTMKIDFSIFFVTCVFIAGIVGGLTSSKKIIFVQTLPAGISLIFLILDLVG